MFAAVAVLMACSEKKAGYTITGSVEFEGTSDGDTVFLLKRINNQVARVDTTIVTHGTFTFEGVADSAEQCQLNVFTKEAGYVNFDFFLENGEIRYEGRKGYWTVTGTPCNDAYTVYRDGMENIENLYSETYKAWCDTTLSEELRAEKKVKLDSCVKQIEDFYTEQIEKNITSSVGAKLIRDHQTDILYHSDLNKMDSLLKQVPEKYAHIGVIAYVMGGVQAKMKTTVGKKYTDFEMRTPDGKPVRISDYIGKNKVVLIDFWASWCGPCRAAIPELKRIYTDYHDKGFEVISVSLDGSADNWKKAIKEEQLIWPQMSDLKGWGCEGAAIYGVRMIPALVLIDAEGTIISRDISNGDLRKKLEELLK